MGERGEGKVRLRRRRDKEGKKVYGGSKERKREEIK